MLLIVTHETRYDYAPPVATAQHMAHLKPRATDTQKLLQHVLRITPKPAQRSESVDVFGNTRAFFAFESTHEQLVVTAESVVQTAVPAPPPAALREQSWERVRETFRYRKGMRDDPASEFIFPSPHVPLDEHFITYAQASFTPGRPLFEAALDLCRRIYIDFEYASGSTEINTPAVQALAERRGVCQDFSHIMIACLRNLGLSARYVSGYLLTQPPPGQARLIGADASHAWVEVYLPPVPAEDGSDDSAHEVFVNDCADTPPTTGASDASDTTDTADASTVVPDSASEAAQTLRTQALPSQPAPQSAGHWVGFCPTNGRQPGEDYVKLAVGRDFADVSPMRGILHGGASHVLHVGVTVMPFDELPVEQQAQWLPARPHAHGALPHPQDMLSQMGERECGQAQMG